MMIAPDFVGMMARYNAWQNDNLITAADSLDDAARQEDRGAFFGSIFATFNHLLWGDRIWLSRFTDVPGPTQDAANHTRETPDWASFKVGRAEQDQRILTWSEQVQAADLAGNLTWYSGVAGKELSKPMAVCVMQLFNHQTHHRGQIHAMLTAAGVRPSDTDIPFMPGL